VLYRIYTEDKNREDIKRTCDKYLPDYSLFYGEGVYKGHHEKSLVIEIVGEDGSLAQSVIIGIAQAIKLMNQQEAVLIVKLTGESQFI